MGSGEDRRVCRRGIALLWRAVVVAPEQGSKARRHVRACGRFASDRGAARISSSGLRNPALLQQELEFRLVRTAPADRSARE